MLKCGSLAANGAGLSTPEEMRAGSYAGNTKGLPPLNVAGNLPQHKSQPAKASPLSRSSAAVGESCSEPHHSRMQNARCARKACV